MQYRPAAGLSNTQSDYNFVDATNWLRNLYPGRVTGSGGNLFVDGVRYTWHHLEDGKTLVPVLQSVHTASKGGLNHTGGFSVLQKGLVGFFE
ncbi:MAG: HNH endonuclease [Saprospiraceae bacterium]|nr:HNH endonuclease [Saprospiraceae bacterium]